MANVPQEKRLAGQDHSPDPNPKKANAEPTLSTQDKETNQPSETNRKRPRPLSSRITQHPNQAISTEQ
ncbi:hypothetical protein PCASD_01622 [Puccinia coronata f. sp. avenae]|uniref:Uncharacterized protein n=1 Tax=Puccinia coronata f. sp. avenae TaxID=200324 RepID=A0A2N5VIN1_9BASI|nr:hypothetical protein PCASD_01622 [Puccinia coronata f. sp. avenae]